jgi:glycosyltransferase involved in cell wall biosynthesis
MIFSVIIPAKNEESNIKNCIDSINSVNFDRNEYEVLVIDNGSLDATVEVAKRRGAQTFVKPDVTISALRNFGATQAQGEILAFLDADCTVHATWLQEASRYLTEREILCFGSPPTVPADASWVQKAWFQVRGKEGVIRDVEWLESMNMFIRKRSFKELGGFDESLVTCEDYDLSVRLHPLGRIVSDHRIVAVHHGEAATLSHFFRKESWRGVSNLKGMLSHGLRWSELPSLAMPLFYCGLGFVTLIYTLAWISIAHGSNAHVIGTLWFAWQGPLVFLTLAKTLRSRNPVLAFQLYVLFNTYFLARGRAIVGRNS